MSTVATANAGAQIILASASPRRAELLNQIDISFRQCAVDLDESVLGGESPRDYVQRLALAKAAAGWRQSRECGLPVLGSDTTVVIGGDILGKPESREQGLAMLQSLSGNTHSVMTAVALQHGERCCSALSVTEVSFRPLSMAEIENYWHSGEPQGKAGGYAIQGRGAVFVEGIKGSYSGVVGLPLAETWQLLQQMDVECG